MKRLAGNEAVVVVPVVVEPVEVQVPLVTVPVEVRDVQVAVRVPQKYATHHLCHHPLNLSADRQVLNYVVFYLEMLSHQ